MVTQVDNFFVDKLVNVVIAFFKVSLAYILDNLKFLLKITTRKFLSAELFCFLSLFSLLNTLAFALLFCFSFKENVMDEIIPNLYPDRQFGLFEI